MHSVICAEWLCGLKKVSGVAVCRQTLQISNGIATGSGKFSNTEDYCVLRISIFCLNFSKVEDLLSANFAFLDKIFHQKDFSTS